MKNMLKLASAVLALILIIGCLSGCGTKAPADTPAAETTAATTAAAETAKTEEKPTEAPQAEICGAAGEYLLDGSALGMPMQWYLKITEAGEFQISTKRDYEADKGHGQVAQSNGTYVLVYSDSTNDAPKNATFKLDKGNVSFTTSLPIGVSNMPGSEEAPFIGYCFANEDLLGEYVSAYDSESAMGTVHYDMDLALTTGRRYTYSSEFQMKGTVYTYSESGSFEIRDTQITLTADRKVTMENISTGELTSCEPETAVGTIADGRITIALATSPMKPDKIENIFSAATTSEAAGTYIGLKKTENFTVESVLKLGKAGTYSYESSFVSPMMGSTEHYEEGTYAVTETGAVLTAVQTRNEDGTMAAAEGTVELTRNGLVYTGSLPTGGMPTAMSLYSSTVIGTFEANDLSSGAVEGKNYIPVLQTRGDGSFTLTVSCEGEENYVCDGTFTAEDSMITFTYAEGAYSFVAVTGEKTINARNIPLNEEGTEASFEFGPAALTEEVPAAAEQTAPMQAPAETEQPAVTEAPTEAEQPAETEAPTEAEQTAETEAPAEAEQPEAAVQSADAEETGEEAAQAAVVRAFSGGYLSESAMGTTQYSISLNLKEDASYRYESVFVMGGTAYVSAEEGAYTIEGETLTLTPQKTTTMATIESGELTDIAAEEQTPIAGKLADGRLTIGHKASCMAKAAVDLELEEKAVVEKAENNELTKAQSFKGTYTSESAMGTTVYDQTLVLKNDGSYRFESAFTMGGKTYVSAEEGIYTLEGEALTLTPQKTTTMATIESGELTDIAAEEQAPITGTLADGKVAISHKASCMAKAAADLELFAPTVYSGSYVSETGIGNIGYTMALALNSNGTYRFESSFEMLGSPYTSVEEGTYTLEGEVLTLTALKTTTMNTIETGELTDIPVEEQAAITASLADGRLSMIHKPSCMAKAAADIELSAQ